MKKLFYHTIETLFHKAELENNIENRCLRTKNQIFFEEMTKCTGYIISTILFFPKLGFQSNKSA
jgi:hypothetical protein